MSGLPSGYDHVWMFDFEYVADPGEVPEPVCFVALDLVSGREVRLWRSEMEGGTPFDTGGDSLFVCFSGVGDIGCFLELDWATPTRLIDLYPEVRQLFYDGDEYRKPSLINACRYFGVETMASQDKDTARDLIIDRKFHESDKEYLLDYCRDDVVLTKTLFLRLSAVLTLNAADWSAALIRGRYTVALAKVERNGIPLDMASLSLAREHWAAVQQSIISRVDCGGVYEGATFKADRFEKLLSRLQVSWPRSESGVLELGDDTFRRMATAHGGVIQNIREVRYTLSKMRLASYVVGSDNRNRVYLNPYGAVTGRNQPSNSKFIFGSARWTRGFIKAPPGKGVVYVDWSSQEIGIAAALSGDQALWEDYQAGDIYIAFAIRGGLAPAGASKRTHPKERKMAKETVLGLGYGLTEHGLAPRLGITRSCARDLIQIHREAYPTFHAWVEQQAMWGSLGLPLRTPLGWVRRLKPGSQPNLRSLKNFYMQGTGAEMLRLALCELTEAGVQVCCPVHDAVLCEFESVNKDRDIKLIQKIMGDVSEKVLGPGYRIRAPVDMQNDVFEHPRCYEDENAGDMYEKVMEIAREAEALKKTSDGAAINSLQADTQRIGANVP